MTTNGQAWHGPAWRAPFCGVRYGTEFEEADRQSNEDLAACLLIDGAICEFAAEALAGLGRQEAHDRALEVIDDMVIAFDLLGAAH